MTKKNGRPKQTIPWFVRADDRAELVYRHDPAVAAFPETELDVAPIGLVRLKRGKTPAVFKTRPLKNREHMGLASISIRGLKDDDLQEQYLSATYEISTMCVEEVKHPDGSSWDNDAWRDQCDQVLPGIMIGIGVYVLSESAWDPTKAKEAPT